MPSEFCCGLDLGQSIDYSALVVAQRKNEDFHVRFAHRWPLGTSYPAIIKDVAKLFSRPPLAGASLVVDATGCGRPVVQSLHVQRPDCHIVPVVITGGFNTSRSRGYVSVPKQDLVGSLRMLLGHNRLKISSKLPLAKTLQRELENFQLTITEKGTDLYGNADTKTHDDTTIALCLLAWHVTRYRINNPLRTYEIKPQKTAGRHIVVIGKDDVPNLLLDADLPTVILSFTCSSAGLPPLRRLLGRHFVECADTDPAEIEGSWTTQEQEGILSPQKAKALWSFLTAPDIQKWNCAVVIDNGPPDRRALSLACALRDVYGLPHTSLVQHGVEDDPDCYTEEGEGPPNQWIYKTVKLARHLVC